MAAMHALKWVIMQWVRIENISGNYEIINDGTGKVLI